jgi:carboxynorspermidine decarboxylase
VSASPVLPAFYHRLNLHDLPSPAYVIDEAALTRNLQCLADVAERSGATILLALKAFACPSLAPLIRRYLAGTCASGLHEARLGRECFGGEVHTYAAAYRPDHMADILALSDHVVFNSFSQWRRYKTQALTAQTHKPGLRFGLRINPQLSLGSTPLYDPCAPCSRMGTPLEQFTGEDLSGLNGLHFHTLCQQNYAALAATLDEVEAQFGHLLPELEWINLGGGHHITRSDYDIEALIQRIQALRERYGLTVYLEPGEAIALNSGIFVTEVLDLLHNGMNLAIVDGSATCHMPDVLEMPYRPPLLGSLESTEGAHVYRLGGPSCLSGDVIGDYAFAQPLQIGQRLAFEDMAIYTMVKNTTFNGIPLPAIILANPETGDWKILKEFGYEDFKTRLG